MRLVVDALAARFGGSAFASTQVARRHAADPALDGVTVVTRSDSLVHNGLRHTDVELVLLPARGHGEIARRVAWEALVLPRLARGAALLSWSGMVPRPAGNRTVCMLANPIMVDGANVSDRLRRAAVRRTAGAAAVMTVPSEGMRALVGRLGIDAAVVPLGVDSERLTPAVSPGSEVLCVADFYEHKRHDLVLDAWELLPTPRPHLRLVGDPRVDPGVFRRIQARAAAHGGAISIEHHLALGDLIAAYRAARVVVVASELESFCMPLLEAQACGVPVITRDTPSLRTTGGPAAVYVDGDDPADWVAALARVLTDDAAHAAARIAGRAHAGTFTWDRTADALRDLLVG